MKCKILNKSIAHKTVLQRPLALASISIYNEWVQCEMLPLTALPKCTGWFPPPQRLPLLFINNNWDQCTCIIDHFHHYSTLFLRCCMKWSNYDEVKFSTAHFAVILTTWQNISIQIITNCKHKRWRNESWIWLQWEDGSTFFRNTSNRKWWFSCRLSIISQYYQNLSVISQYYQDRPLPFHITSSITYTFPACNSSLFSAMLSSL